MSIEITTPIIDEKTAKIVGYNTSEPSVYFLISNRWITRRYENNQSVFIKSVGEQEVDVRFALSADYAHAAASVLQIRTQDAGAMFFPMPLQYKLFQLFLPEQLGKTQIALSPDAEFHNYPIAYYRARFTISQLNTLKQLARSGLTLTGSILVSYFIENSEVESAIPITVELKTDDLEISQTQNDFDSVSWIKEIISSSFLQHTGSIDGEYSLGNFLHITLSKSKIYGFFIRNTFDVNKKNNQFNCFSLYSPNFKGTIDFLIKEIDSSIKSDYTATIELSLKIENVEVSIVDLQLNSMSIDGNLSQFYLTFMNHFLSSKKIRIEISNALTNELQKRILSQTLFGIDS